MTYNHAHFRLGCIFFKEKSVIRIGILASHIDDEEKRLVESGQSKGHDVDMLEVRRFGIGMCPNEPTIFYEGTRITDQYDAIIPRIDLPYTEFGYTVLRQFQAMDIYVTDTAYSLELCRDKIRCMQYLMRQNVPFPTTGSAYSRAEYDQVIKTVGGAPLIIKLNEGTEGVGVFLAEDDKAAKNFLRTFKKLDTRVMLQKFVQESSGSDIRAVVIGGKIVGALQRESQDGDFRANISLGAKTTAIELTEQEQDVALRATEAMGLSMAGVDIMRSENGPVIIEVNSAQDFTKKEDVENVANIDLAGMMIDVAVEGKKKFDAGEGVWLREQPI